MNHIQNVTQKPQSLIILKVKLVRNSSTWDVISSSLETAIFNPRKVLGVLDLRSVGYYEIKHDVLQQSLSKYFKFEDSSINL